MKMTPLLFLSITILVGGLPPKASSADLDAAAALLMVAPPPVAVDTPVKPEAIPTPPRPAVPNLVSYKDGVSRSLAEDLPLIVFVSRKATEVPGCLVCECEPREWWKADMIVVSWHVAGDHIGCAVTDCPDSLIPHMSYIMLLDGAGPIPPSLTLHIRQNRINANVLDLSKAAKAAKVNPDNSSCPNGQCPVPARPSIPSSPYAGDQCPPIPPPSFPASPVAPLVPWNAPPRPLPSFPVATPRLLSNVPICPTCPRR